MSEDPPFLSLAATHRLRAIHGAQPGAMILLAKRLKCIDNAGLLLECQIEAETLLELGCTTLAREQCQFLILTRLRSRKAVIHLIELEHGELALLFLECAIVFRPCCFERL